jgi:hypothetical protein
MHLMNATLRMFASTSSSSTASTTIAHDYDTSNNTSLSPTKSTSISIKSKHGSKDVVYGGKIADPVEIHGISELRSLLSSYHSEAQSKWIRNDEVEDTELLRFLRARNGNIQQAYKMIIAHDKWRVSQFGAESDYIKSAYIHSPLKHEIFWLGLDKEGCPTLAVRTQVHDGLYYNDDPKIYTG